ncbi:MAG: NAD(P)/FAD-dependent oxidoreductase [Pirellulales bacterium]|nr:NAD(P)/FAD-dependent oxidoreductase [Pirellulales bacterium]
MAATVAAERGRRVLLLEKNRKPGAKILMSGGTRCNITQAVDVRGIVAAFGRKGKFLHSALAALSPDDLVAMIESEGVPTKIESTGKIFPASNRSVDVLQAFLAKLQRSGAELRANTGVTQFDASQERQGDVSLPRFAVRTDQQNYAASSVILTTGGQSYPGCGTTGDGYAWAKRLGHCIVPPRPALVPLTTSAAWISSLQGMTVSDVEISLLEQQSAEPTAAQISAPCESHTLEKLLDRRRGSLLFAHFGLSGPVVLDISSQYTGHPRRDALVLRCDFLPEVAAAQLDQQLRSLAAQAGSQTIISSLAEKLPKRLVATLFNQAKVPMDRRAAELRSTERTALVNAIKGTVTALAGTLGFKKAEVTAGGVDLAEVDSRTLESKLCPGLFLAGEILDLDGPIGGYNFQAAFSTGFLAGRSV